MSSFKTIEISNPEFEMNGLRFLTIKTPNLLGRGDICLYVPNGNHQNLPIYILLHGVYGSAWVWSMKGRVHLTAKEMMDTGEIAPAILAMPSDGLWGDGSAYFSHHGKQFDQWIVNDVPKAVIENVPQASQNHLCIGGLSMGGYGALRLGGLHPDRFSAISGHSSITQFAQMAQFVEEPIASYQAQSKYPNIIDIFKENNHRLPPIRFDCGVDDELLEANRVLHKEMIDSNIDHSFEEFEGGHEWPYWIKHVKKSLTFFDTNTSKNDDIS